MRNDAYVGTSVYQPQVFAALHRTVRVDYYGRYFAHHLIGVDKRIDQRIGKGDEKKEYQDTLVFDAQFQLFLADVEQSVKSLFDGMSE